MLTHTAEYLQSVILTAKAKFSTTASSNTVCTNDYYIDGQPEIAVWTMEIQIGSAYVSESVIDIIKIPKANMGYLTKRSLKKCPQVALVQTGTQYTTSMKLKCTHNYRTLPTSAFIGIANICYFYTKSFMNAAETIIYRSYRKVNAST